MDILEINLTEIMSVGLRSGMSGQAHDKTNRTGVGSKALTTLPPTRANVYEHTCVCACVCNPVCRKFKRFGG